MKAGYLRVGPDPSGTAVGKIRKIRCGCTNEVLSNSKLYVSGVAWGKSKVNYFMGDDFEILRCSNCGEAMWYTT